MKEGSVGPDVGQIEQWLNGRYMRICGEDYVTENFRFGPKETEGVRAAQERANLLVTGTGERGDLGCAPCPELRMRGGMTDGTAADLRCL